MHILNHKLRTI